MISFCTLAFLMGKTPLELFSSGGPLMWPILLVSFVVVTVVLERTTFLLLEARRRNPALVERILDRVSAGDAAGALTLGRDSRDFVVRVLVHALSHRDQSRSSAFLHAANRELKRFQHGLAVLDTCITAAPLLGLLGTVTGMMNTFGALGNGDIAANASSITGGVGEALIATMCGLAIAIVALLPFNILNAQVEQARHDLTDAANALELSLRSEVATPVR